MSTPTTTVIGFRKSCAKSARDPFARRGRYLLTSNGGLSDLDAELEQFAVNARCAPARVVEAHLTDQIAYFVARLGASGTA